MRSNLISCLKRILTKEEAIDVAEQLSNMIDGLWLRYSVDSSQLDSLAASHYIDQYLSRFGITR